MRSLLIAVACLASVAIFAEDHAWERVISKFEQGDKETPPPAKPILFTGSSSIVLWKVNDAYPDLPVINRGFGGSNFGDLNHYFDRVVKRYDPSVLVIYSGDNDLASGETAEQVYGEFEKFAERTRTELPETKLVVVGVKPSRARWHLYHEAQKLNARMKEYLEKHQSMKFVDLGQHLLDDKGEPNNELFVGDRLHLNAAGYAIWSEKFRPVLDQLVKR